MKLRKTDFIGTGKVFGFTLSQYVKSKANIVTFAILIIICLVSVPLTSLVSEGEEAFSADIPDTLYIQNQTDLPIHCDADDLVAAELTGTRVLDTSDNVLGVRNAIIRFSSENGAVTSEIILSEDTDLGSGAVSALSSLCAKLIIDARCESLGISEDALAAFDNLPSVTVMDANDYLHGTTEDGLSAQFILQYVYSILVMMLTLLSSTYIIRAVIEEKSSKLVELLMVSVKPLALLAGKILAMMTAVFVTIASMVGALLLSNFLSVRFLGTSGFGQMLENFGISFDNLKLDLWTLILTVIGVFIAYLTYAVLAGIAGSCCSATEDADSANTLVILLTIFGYMVSSVSANFTSPFAAHFTSLCPVISAFCAPVQYAMGNISVWVFIASLLIQAFIAFLLIRFCAKVYRALLIHRGSRIKLKQLLKVAKGGTAK